MIRLIATLLFLAGWLLLLAPAPRSLQAGAPRQAEAPVGGAAFNENFNDPTLGGAWSWHNENPDEWSLTERPGFLRIYTEYGSLDGGEANNVLLRAAPSGEYVVETRFELAASAEFHEAALMLYADPDNWVKISRLVQQDLGGHAYLLTYERDGKKEQGRYVATSQTSITLRLVVGEGVVYGQYLDGQGVWRALGAIQTGAAVFPQVGLAAHSGLYVGPAPTSIPADFDYIRATELTLRELFLPIIYR
jgi:beta-xylosidase